MNPSSPPAFARWILARCLHPADRDEVLGDLEQLFRDRSAESPKAARWWYRWQVFLSAPRFFFQSFAHSSVMFKNYLTVAVRSLTRQKVQGGINLAGLTVGIGLCILIMLFVRDEMTFDRFHEGHEQIVQIQDERFDPDGSSRGANSNMPYPLGPTFMEELPGFEGFARTSWEDGHYIRTGGDVIQEQGRFVDPSFLSLFTFPLVAGDPATALDGRSRMVITTSAAERLFGARTREELNAVIGNELEIRFNDTWLPFEVGGVAQDPPGNSTLQFAFLGPIDVWMEQNFPDGITEFEWSLVSTFMQVSPGVQSADMQDRLTTIYAKYNGDYLTRLHEGGEYPEGLQPARYIALPMADLYMDRYSDPRYSWILSAIALGILLIGCINFMTLAIGRSLSRSREVGIRKTVGALRSQLVGQFWGEAFFMTALSTAFGIGLAWLALPWFNELTDKQMTFTLISDWTLPAALFGVVLITGLIAGSYPAFVLSSFKPVDVLKSRLKVSGSNLFTRGLVTLQFALSVSLIIATLIMQKQLDHLLTSDRGFNTERLVIVDLNGVDADLARERFRLAAASDSRIQSISLSSSSLGYRGSNGFAFSHEGERVNVDLLRVDHAFMHDMGIDVALGRAFDPARPADSTGTIVVNQALVERFGIEDPIGSPMAAFPGDEKPIIIGVTPDFSYQSLYQPVGPLMMTVSAMREYRHMYVRVGGSDADAVEGLHETWASVTPDVPLSFDFMDERMARVYQSDLRWGRIINLASGFAIFLALLGLLGLTSLSVRSRTREIGIRKVMGASAGRILRLIISDFAPIIVLGALMAIPAGFWFSDQWLANFAFQTNIGPGVYLIGLGLVLGAALLTICLQSLRSALADPVQSIRAD
jgi:putative ABC transport system permease protein